MLNEIVGTERRKAREAGILFALFVYIYIYTYIDAYVLGVDKIA